MTECVLVCLCVRVSVYIVHVRFSVCICVGLFAFFMCVLAFVCVVD